jgi:hypothetical protein
MNGNTTLTMEKWEVQQENFSEIVRQRTEVMPTEH